MSLNRNSLVVAWPSLAPGTRPALKAIARRRHELARRLGRSILVRHRLLLLLLLVGLGLPALSWAQVERAPLEVDRTEQRIARAHEAVAASGNASAQAELDHAISVQANARAALAAGRPRIAIDLTQRARTSADRAIAVTGDLPDPDRAQTQLDRTREMLDRARPQIEACNRERPRALLRTADDMQRRAEDAAHGGHYLAGLQLTMGARDRVARALRLCNVSDDATDAAERALRRTR